MAQNKRKHRIPDVLALGADENLTQEAECQAMYAGLRQGRTLAARGRPAVPGVWVGRQMQLSTKMQIHNTKLQRFWDDV
jgi:hypothetical protein